MNSSSKDNSDKGYLYILFNPIFKKYGDNVYKLGRTVNLSNRLKSYTTSFIEPSNFIYTSKCFHSSIKAERILFFVLRNYRIRDKREFFNLDLNTIIVTIKQIEDCTENQIDKIYHKINKKICPNDILDKLNDEQYYKHLDFDYSNINTFLEQFRFKPSNPQSYKFYNYVPPQIIELDKLLYFDQQPISNTKN